MILEDGDAADRYIGSALRQEDEGIGVAELTWLLECTHEWGSLRLRLLTALQQALNRGEEDSAAGQLKVALTNLIIMQTRIQERENKLVELLCRAEAESAVGPVVFEVEDLISNAERVLRESRQLRDGHA